MNFLAYGDKSKPAVLLIHGMAAAAELCFGKVLPCLDGYHVILCEADGHTSDKPTEFVSVNKCCEQIEEYVNTVLDGNIYCIGGFSMGGSICVKLLERGIIAPERTFLDAAFCIKMGILTPVFSSVMTWGVKRITSGKGIPAPLLEGFMGKGNTSITDMMFMGITPDTVKRVCTDIYSFEISEKLKEYNGKVLFIYGSNEPYPKKSAALLLKYLPQTEVKVIDGMGHGQFMNERPKEYGELMTEFLA